MKKLFTFLTTAVIGGVPALAYADGEVTKSAFGNNQYMLVMLALLLGFFYFIVLRPERKRRKAMEARRNAMRKGDRITTSTGIRATVHKIEGDTVVVKLYDGAKMELLTAAVTDVQPGNTQEAEGAPAEVVERS